MARYNARCFLIERNSSRRPGSLGTVATGGPQNEIVPWSASRIRNRAAVSEIGAPEAVEPPPVQAAASTSNTARARLIEGWDG